MSDLNKNSDNEQTVYASGDEYSAADQLRKDMSNLRSQKAYPAGNAADPQIYSNQQQGQTLPQNIYANQQHPQQYSPPPQNMYRAPVGYNDPEMQRVPVGYGTKKKKSNTAVIVLAVLIVLLVCVIAGAFAVILLSDKDNDSGSGTKEKISAVYDDEEKNRTAMPMEKVRLKRINRNHPKQRPQNRSDAIQCRMFVE